MTLTPAIVATLPTQPYDKPKGWELLLPVKWQYISPQRALLTASVTTGQMQWDKIVGKLVYYSEPNSIGLYGWYAQTNEGYSLTYSHDISHPDKVLSVDAVAQALVNYHYQTTLQLIDTDKL